METGRCRVASNKPSVSCRIAHLLMEKYSAPARTQRQANIAIALFMSSSPINPYQNMVFLRLKGRLGSLMQRLNLRKLSQLRRFLAAAISSVDRGRALSPRCKRSQPRLRFSCLHLVANLEPPFPDIRFGSLDDGVFDAFVDHGMSLFPKAGEDNVFDSPGNSGNYGNRIPVDRVSVSRLQIDTSIASRRTRAPPQEINYPSASRKPLLEADL